MLLVPPSPSCTIDRPFTVLTETKSIEFTLRTRTRSNPVQPLSTWKRARNHLLDSSLFGFRSFAGPDPRAQDFSAFSPPQQELSRPSRCCRFVPIFVFLELEHALSSPALVTHQVALNTHTTQANDNQEGSLGS